MKLKVFGKRVLIKWQQKEVLDLKNKGEKLILDSPHSVNENDIAKKIKEKTNVDIPTGEDYPKWEVVRIGEEVKYYKPGDLVLCHANIGTDLPYKENGKDEFYKLLPEDQIFGLWDETL